MQSASVHLNGVDYQFPRQPVVVICIDGGDPAYIAEGIHRGIIPTIQRFIDRGYYSVAQGTVPSFTCPNNMSIITGAPASVHGISGNFYLDRMTGQAVVMTGPELLQSQTILAAFAQAGAKVATITAKDKLCKQLGKGLDFSAGHISFSAEKAAGCTIENNGIENVLEWLGEPQPDMYSMDLSLFVLRAGVRLLKERAPDLMYLSLTDYIQHKYAPGEAGANAFYAALDSLVGELDELGAVIALTADHGMNDKSSPAGSPNVLYLQDELDAHFGFNTTRVICPITDAFVKHHGALGGFVRVYLASAAPSVEDVQSFIKTLPGVEQVLTRNAVCEKYELPFDREGDLAVLANSHTAIGSRAADHDLTELGEFRLRTHGGATEACVPMILNRPLRENYLNKGSIQSLKSHRIFELALNAVETTL